ncbi:hypothetical protein WN55_02394 [Dufourea novaeangliae]|uniref:Mos1 transposase HTH domain-containing protein n=1 Tax=Dufourea novaeangliae TaxID=178035 RepID=A0A154PGU9_DUFNO|nr:hypothetical protein WN55_02394 [Dufourea novaeangliae]
MGINWHGRNREINRERKWSNVNYELCIMLYGHRLNTSSTETAKETNTAFGPGTNSDRTIRFMYKHFDEIDTSCINSLRQPRTTINRHLISMGYLKDMSRWTPRALIYHDRAARVSICQDFL